MAPESGLQLGQVVELVNQPPNYGRSLDGTLARVEWVPALWTGAVIIELYRRHRRTGKPLALRTLLLPVEQLKAIENLSPEQASLLEQVEPLRQDQQARRQRLKADRLAWEQGILAMAKNDQGDLRESIEKLMASAEEGTSQLESLLTRQPPDGVSALDVTAFFQRQRPVLVNMLFDILDSKAEARDPALSQVSARELTPVTISPRMLIDLGTLLDEGEVFKLIVRAGAAHYNFIVTPDVDGLYVAVDGGPMEKKLASIAAADLLAFLPVVMPAAANGNLVAMSNSYVALVDEPDDEGQIEFSRVKAAHSQPPAESKSSVPSPPKPFELTFDEFRSRSAALTVPTNSVLGVDPEQETPATLVRFSKSHLQILAMVTGAPRTGTKDEIARRIVEIWCWRKELSAVTVETLEKRPRVELRRYLDSLHLFKGGNKHTQAVIIINWRNEVRAKGKLAVAEGNWLATISAAVAQGKEISKKVREGLEEKGLAWVLDSEHLVEPEHPTRLEAAKAIDLISQSLIINPPAGASLAQVRAFMRRYRGWLTDELEKLTTRITENRST